ncbi:hypothetical protein BJY59DRAFT_714711 [Rhodotorula toruloides]
MPRDPDPSLNESSFVQTCLRKGLRLDGRGMYEMRSVDVRFGEEFGWVECRLGGTRVVAQVSAEIVKPLPDRPYEGFVSLVTEISPMASAAYEAGRASEDEVLMTRLLEKALRRSNAVDREALCIVAGQKVWSIRVDVHFLDDEGNMLDCVSIAAMTALRHFRRPDVTVVGEEVTVHSMTERVPVPLAIHHSPMCLTFAFFGDDSLAVLDPTHLESQLCTGTLTLALNSQSEICVLSKQGGAPLGADEVMRADRSSRTGNGSRSRSSSRTGFAAKTLGAMEIGGGSGSSRKDDDVPGLSRSNSRLLSTSGSPPPAGILLNPVSPTLNGMLAPSPSFSPVYNHSTPLSASTSNLDLSSSTSTTPGARPTLTRTFSDASSSGVSSHIGPTTPSSAHFPGPSSSATPTGATSPPPISSRPSKIRFAPLPEIRPRRYSTGRNVWIVDEEGDDEDGQPRRTRLVRVGSDLEDGGDEFALDDEDDEEEDVGGGRGGLMGGKFGSWSETFGGGMWGLSPSTTRKSQDEDARSVTSSLGGGGESVSVGSVGSGGSGGGGSSSKKLLKAFGLKPKSKSKHAGTGGDDDSLTRVSSVDSQASRRLSTSTAEAPKPRGSTGIPMRKYASWEVGEAAQNGHASASSAGGGNGAGQAVGSGGGPVYYASPARSARRRANYPPVAQRSRRPAASSHGSRGTKVEEPAFEEWGVGGVGSRSKRTSFSGKEVEEEDDGSGMAWLRKRRLQREREERERREREEAGLEAADEGVKVEEDPSAQKDEEDPPTLESVPAYLDGVRRRTAPGQMPSRSATIESTTSSASTIRPSTPVQHASPSLNNKPSGLSATRPVLSVDVADRREGSSSTDSPSGSGSDETPITSPISNENEAEESEEEGEREEEEEDDDDLDAEELAREEALAEAAKRSAKSMGAERYHSAGHQDELRVLEDRA